MSVTSFIYLFTSKVIQHFRFNRKVLFGRKVSGAHWGFRQRCIAQNEGGSASLYNFCEVGISPSSHKSKGEHMPLPTLSGGSSTAIRHFKN